MKQGERIFYIFLQNKIIMLDNKIIKRIQNNPDYNNTLIYALYKKDGDLIVKQIDKYFKGGKTDLLKIIKSELNDKQNGGKTEIMKFKGQKCIIYSPDFMLCYKKLSEGQEFGLKYLVEILKNNGWSVYINNGDNGLDTNDYMPDINLFIKYSFCNTPNTKLYYSNPNIDLTFGGINNDWVDYYFNKYKIYEYDFNKINKIPSKSINTYLSEDYLDEIKNYIEENKNNIEYNKFILKPLNSYSGHGIFYVDSKCDIDDINKQLKNKNFPYVIQPLIENTARFKNRVSHLRCHILVSCFLKKDSTIDNKQYKIKSSLYDRYFIITAKDSKSYDSHGHTTDQMLVFQDNYKKFDCKLNLKQIENEIQDIHKVFKKVIKKNFKNNKFNFVYDDRNSIYALFAPDIMITKDGHVKLIEFNYKVGTTFGQLETDQIENKKMIEWEYNNGIKPMEN